MRGRATNVDAGVIYATSSSGGTHLVGARCTGVVATGECGRIDFGLRLCRGLAPVR